MKLSLALITVLALAACGPVTVGGTSAWDRAANGSCYDVQVNLPADKPPACPNRDHFAPSEVDRSKDGKIVAYICVCQR